MAILDLDSSAPAAGSDNQGQQAPAKAEAAVSAPEWLSDIDESLKGDKSLHKFSGEKWKENLAKSYVELEKKLGSTVQVPKEGASEEEWGKFFSKIGRPDSPDKYELPGEIADEVKAVVAKEAFKNGVTPKQLQSVIAALQQGGQAQMAKADEAVQKEYETAVSTLKSEYGNDFDSNVQLAAKALHGLFPNGSAAILEKSLGNDPRLIRDLVALGKRLGEDGIVKGEAPAAKKSHPYDWMRTEFKSAD